MRALARWIIRAIGDYGVIRSWYRLGGKGGKERGWHIPGRFGYSEDLLRTTSLKAWKHLHHVKITPSIYIPLSTFHQICAGRTGIYRKRCKGDGLCVHIFPGMPVCALSCSIMVCLVPELIHHDPVAVHHTAAHRSGNLP